MVDWRLEQREKKYSYKTKRPPKKHIKPTERQVRNAARSRRARDRKQMQPTREVKAQRASIPTTPALRRQGPDESANRQKTERATSKRGGDQGYRTGNRYELP
ncbi:hypothetical protein GGS24DRAFT_464567 [Hypoxylon argillaceum]|nr:hypothetical protein GGS24DRAFT_464567 [Hypoxylon argillaceum]